MLKIGVMVAFVDEIPHEMLNQQQATVEEYAGIEYHCGPWQDRELVVCCGGMGKVNAAATVQSLICHFGVDLIIFSGIGGNMSTKIGIGDVVIGKELCHHDGEDRMFARTSPFTAQYTADERLVALVAKACEETGIRFIIGRIATGDQFVGDAETKRAIQEKCHPDCVEMEGAAIAQVCMRNKVPFVVIRAMSDNSDESIDSLGAEEFDVNEYVKTSNRILMQTLALIDEQAFAK